MLQTLNCYSTTFSRRLAAWGLGFLTMFVFIASVHASEQCRRVRGLIFEETVTENCDSTSNPPLCIASEYIGGIKGTGEIEVNEFLFADSLNETSISLFASDSTVEAKIGRRTGKLFIKHAGAFNLAGGNELVDLQTIVGGDGDFSGATGFLQVIGDFILAENSGESRYVGEVCLP